MRAGKGVSCSVLLLAYACTFCVHLSASSSSPQGIACHQGDMAAMAGFLRGLDAHAIQGWEFNSPSASASANCCGWTGVTCDNSTTSSSKNTSVTRVVGLDLSNRGLKGHLNNSLAAMDHLVLLNLSQNSLLGSVPPGLLRLQRLEHLDLSSNHELFGEIPPDASLPSIKTFNIAFNKLSGHHPVLAGSGNLMELDIRSNQFSGPIDAISICSESSQVQVLRFSDNRFTGEIPAGFGRCTSLAVLTLGWNGLSGPLPKDLFEASSLMELVIRNNKLSGEIDAKVGNLYNLTKLDLSFNKLAGFLPATLSNISKLEHLDLENNVLQGGIHLNFTSMRRLKKLALGGNQFTGTIPESISSIPDLQIISLYYNKLQGEIPESFKHLQALSFLTLTNNSLVNISSTLRTMEQCHNLQYLELSMNYYGETLPSEGIGGFVNLGTFILRDGSLTGQVPSWLVRSRQLRLLDLSWNRLEGNVPAWLGNFHNLFILDLSNNSLTGEIPRSLTQLRSFHSQSPIPTEPQEGASLDGFAASLSLSNNMLVGSIPPDFGNCDVLQILDLSRNNLTGGIPDVLGDMTRLEILDLSHNELTGRIPASLTRLSFLSNFSVAYNDLVGWVPAGGQFSTFPNSSFEGNRGLCGGFSLPACDTRAPSEPANKRPPERGGVDIGEAIVPFTTGMVTCFFVTVYGMFTWMSRWKKLEDAMEGNMLAWRSSR